MVAVNASKLDIRILPFTFMISSGMYIIGMVNELMLTNIMNDLERT